MSNMKHCRFENTYKDLSDCEDALAESTVSELIEQANQYEKPYIKKLIKLCVSIADNYGDEAED
jgi:hypothetical protein